MTKGDKKILARLGSEANEILDAFMDYTLTIQKTGLPGLQAFLETLSANKPEIKRELDQNHEEVRIMTVHAAKGLESAVVFLVDPGSAIWDSCYIPHFFTFSLNGRQAFIWRPNAQFNTKFFEKALSYLKERVEEEYKRLLYVGMTRAEDRLIVCGYSSQKENSNTWLKLVKKALHPHSVTIKGPTEDIAAWRYSITNSSNPINKEILDEDKQTFPPLPAFFHHKMPSQPALSKPLRPSVAGPSIDIDTELSPHQAHLSISPILGEKNTNKIFSIEYGNLVHRLLQYLPECPPQKRLDYARRYLNIKASHWPEIQREKALYQVWEVLENSNLKSLFSANSKAEVSLMGTVKIHGKEQIISGQIDRLCITQDNVLFADFKTGIPPENEATIAPNYLLQMALYRKLLQTIYPDKNIDAFLIYCKEAKIFTLTSEKLNACLNEFA